MAITCPRCGHGIHQFDMTPFKILELIVSFDWRSLNDDEITLYKPVFGKVPLDGARALETSDGTRLFIINNMTMYSFELGTTKSQGKWVLLHVTNQEGSNGK